MKTRIVSILICCALCFIGIRLRPQQPPAPSHYDPSAQTVLIRFGVTDKANQKWTGSLGPASSDSEVVALRGYRFMSSDSINGSEFSFISREWNDGIKEVDLSPPRPGPRAVLPNGVFAILKGQPGSRFALKANGVEYAFSLSDLAARKLATFAEGNIEVEAAPSEMPLTAPAAGQADYPSLASDKSGNLAAVWQEFMGERDRIVVRTFNGSSWSAPEAIETEETRDVIRPTAAYDAEGALHVIWSAQVADDWDLFERRKTAQGWQPVARLTSTPGPDLYPRAIESAKGDVYLAWQGFRTGRSDIYLKRFTHGAWGADLKVSLSTANDWEPAIAAAPDGSVWVGWDGYDLGNYDVFVRQFNGDLASPERAITHSPRFEAHVSLACDPQNRLWIAFEEAEANWGKDYGYLVKDRGNPLYQSRHIRVARLAGSTLEEPASSIENAFPLGVTPFLQYPKVSVSPDGAVTVLAMQMVHATMVVEVWGARGVWDQVAFTLGPQGWKRHQEIPASEGDHDIRSALGADSKGNLWTAWASDGRDLIAKVDKQTIHAARLLPEPGGAAAMKAYTEKPDLSFPVHPNEAANLKTIRDYRIRSGNHIYRIFRGDLHRHTALSADGAGDGSLWDFYRYELDAADMDFATVTDHQGGISPYDWWLIQKSVDMFFMPGRLTTIYAYERSVPYPNGHRNIVLPKRGVPILPITPSENRGEVRSADAVLPYLRKWGAIAFRHTTATNQGTDWKDHNNELEPLVEVYQGHRLAYDHEGAPKGMLASKEYTHRSGYQPAGYIWNALAKGYRFGFEASSDHTSTHISYSCIFNEDGTRQGMINAMRLRHTYGATDNIVLDFRLKAGAEEHVQGDEFSAPGPYTLSVNVIGTGPIRRIDVIHNEQYVYTTTPTGRSATSFTYTDPNPATGENRYYVRVQQEDGNLAWSSPVWAK